MATINKEGLTGLVGSVVIYNMNGKQYARTKPAISKTRKKQLAQSNEAIVFGLVSAYGSAMLGILRNYLNFSFSLATYNAARGWIRNQYGPNMEKTDWPLSSRFNTNCQLNPKADLRDFLKAGVTISDEGKGHIKISMEAIQPLQQIVAPAGTKAVKLKWIVLSTPFSPDGNGIVHSLQEYSIPYTNAVFAARETEIVIKGKKGDIVMVVAAMEFERKVSTPLEGFFKDAAYLPAAIMGIGKLKK